jgi:type III restriction enzyme
VEGVYHERRNALGEDVPNFTIKVPTGGGKTLIATQVLGDVFNSLLKERKGSGLVIWATSNVTGGALDDSEPTKRHSIGRASAPPVTSPKHTSRPQVAVLTCSAMLAGASLDDVRHGAV